MATVWRMADRDRYEFGPPVRLGITGKWHKVEGAGLPTAGVYVRLGQADDGRLVCTGVHVAEHHGGQEVTATDLRRVPLAAILGDVAAYLAGGDSEDPLTKAVTTKMANDVLRQHATPFVRAARSTTLRPEHFERVAADYRAALLTAPNRPIQYLAKRDRVPEPTLRRWVQRARDMGLLGESTPGKAGETPRKEHQ